MSRGLNKVKEWVKLITDERIFQVGEQHSASVLKLIKHLECLKKNREASAAGKIQARDENDKRWSWKSQGQDYVSP